MKCFAALLLAFCILACAGKDLTIDVKTDGDQTTLNAGLSIGLKAEIHHASGNQGVSWSLVGCTNNCGNLSSTMANPVTYTAPAVVSASFNVMVVATAAANPSKTASVTLTIQPIGVPVQ